MRGQIGVQTGTINGIGPHEGTYRKEQGSVRGWAQLEDGTPGGNRLHNRARAPGGKGAPEEG